MLHDAAAGYGSSSDSVVTAGEVVVWAVATRLCLSLVIGEVTWADSVE